MSNVLTYRTRSLIAVMGLETRLLRKKTYWIIFYISKGMW